MLREAPPPISHLPSGEYARVVMFKYSENFRTGFQDPTEKVQMAAFWIWFCSSSTPPTARVRPSGEKLTLETSPGKSSDLSKVPLGQSQIFAVLSLETEASIC